ncbi:alpha/beta fold hydrolase [Mycobacterium sp. URHB0044]|uniref:alpha/beta fold hydrolase n=1 Tax=Mycobacterium sp. URHB0044 TaxID=1380386 RepID=UPI00056AB426|nr:alpha/beta hydrolase [Mycobacterium sp. URHB0044]
MTNGSATPAAVAFIHGGVHTGRCWDDTITTIRELLPSTEAFAVDLPGRRDIPGDLATLTRQGCVDSLAEQISERVGPGGGPVVIVGHSLAGVVIPGLVHRLGVHRVQRVVFVACCMPPPGRSVLQTLPFPLDRFARRIVERAPIIEAPRALVRYMFGNRATPAQRVAMRANLCAESSALVTGTSMVRLPPSVPTSWILTEHDRALPPRLQRKFIRELGGVDTVVTIDSGHEPMFTAPRELAHHVVRCVAC